MIFASPTVFHYFSIVGAAALILVYTADWYSFEKLMIIM